MARAPAVERREDVLDRIVEHLLAQGVRDLTVRRLAGAVGTSHRMLNYYFGSKEELLRAVYTALRTRFTQLVGAAAATVDDKVPLGRLLWNAMLADPRVLPLMGQIAGLALLEPEIYGELAAEHLRELVRLNEAILAESLVPDDRRPAMATLIVAAIRGLQIDLVTTKDRERVEAAFTELEGLVTLLGDSLR